MMDDYKDAAYVAYDTTIHKKAEVHGFSAFSEAFEGTSVVHYGVHNMK